MLTRQVRPNLVAHFYSLDFQLLIVRIRRKYYS